MKNISIMGCGWLGLPLAERLVEAGYQIKGSTTTNAKVPLLQQKGIHPFRLHLEEMETGENALAAFLQSEVLVLNIPPQLRRGGGEAYLRQMKLLQKALLKAPVRRVLFVSSTSVYPDLNRPVTEKDAALTAVQAPGYALLQAENMFREQTKWQTTVVRFAGLVGGNRHPGRFLAGKTNVAGSNAPVNLIHLDDCLAILKRIIETGKWGNVYNACSDVHPSRREFYIKAAKQLDLEPPVFDEDQKAAYKIINSDKLKQDLSYSFLYPDPLAFF